MSTPTGSKIVQEFVSVGGHDNFERLVKRGLKG